MRSGGYPDVLQPVTQPFTVARYIRAVCGQSGATLDADRPECHRHHLHRGTRSESPTWRSARTEFQVLVDGERAGLTVREFELFLLLAERPTASCSAPEIYALMWGGEMPRRDRSVDVLVRKVRAKLELVAPDWRYIHTHFGIGYRFHRRARPQARGPAS